MDLRFTESHTAKKVVVCANSFVSVRVSSASFDIAAFIVMIRS